MSVCNHFGYYGTQRIFNWETANGGGAKRIVRFRGGGGKRAAECPFKTQFFESSESGIDLVCARSL